MNINLKRIVAYETGAIVPEGAVFLSSVPNGKLYDSVTKSFVHNDKQQVTHYFLVQQVFDDVADKTEITELSKFNEED